MTQLQRLTGSRAYPEGGGHQPRRKTYLKGTWPTSNACNQNRGTSTGACSLELQEPSAESPAAQRAAVTWSHQSHMNEDREMPEQW